MPQILWAEDSAMDRVVIQALLQDLPGPPAVEFVEDGQDLLDRLDACVPDLVVLDLSMPRVGGLEALSLLRQRSFGVPVVIFSGSQGAETMEACRRLGAVEFVQKPGDLREFRSRLERVVAPLGPMVAA